MSVPLKYETPENVQIEYRPAGIGTRFIAWFVDVIILNFAMFLLFIVLLIIGALFEGLFRDTIRSIDKLVNEDGKKTDPEMVGAYLIGIGFGEGPWAILLQNGPSGATIRIRGNTTRRPFGLSSLSGIP